MVCLVRVSAVVLGAILSLFIEDFGADGWGIFNLAGQTDACGADGYLAHQQIMIRIARFQAVARDGGFA
nr:hypothetical protein [Pseudomonas tremae]